MNNESQTISIESILHQATTPWLSFVLAPLGYCFIGLILALRQQQFQFLHFVVLFFIFCSYLLTRKFISQTSTSSREKEMASHCINECYSLCHSLLFLPNGSY